jgi:hypothetical protein
LLFCRYLPMVAMAEVKAVLPTNHEETKHTKTHEGDLPRRHGDTEEAQRRRN